MTTQREPVARVAVLVPTYNERDNLPLILARLRASVPAADLFVLDDNSPDGTGTVADELAAQDDRIRVVHRAGKEGLGRAYLAGFALALEEGYDVAVEIDADGSHQPEQLPQILAALTDADLVIGARWIPGGQVRNWPLRRKLLSVGANLYTKVLLGMGVNDATAGYRAYRTSALRTMDLNGVESQGYCFQIDLTLRAIRAGLTVVEVPITFVEREVGVSKMGQDIVREALLNVTKWGLEHRVGQLRSALQRKRPPASAGEPEPDPVDLGREP
ncbi:polyprenol monophosphomannose synthase [Intrasporangium calvum]|uniref:Dolichyl-phosphate beta-D-mannosyltransferase n=1 Tax=Intrasporangium calvum (strain ATCC 23552 / DSM 43043 / JCM 3097 / NBRC 12989 / NCIMB 10167 / NRRL B-3866 / 7 KIP) TaxID=710696 RepID=E6SAN4_INTC7|nr:polyprenol monophosphomannose synthase [Intrasporangium calvum]ADU48307.1 Dolichyl-phosphate beta-D-mannosyltransferase [Intrasporangium calvum DSM 43043]